MDSALTREAFFWLTLQCFEHFYTLQPARNTAIATISLTAASMRDQSLHAQTIIPFIFS